MLTGHASLDCHVRRREPVRCSLVLQRWHVSSAVMTVTLYPHTHLLLLRPPLLLFASTHIQHSHTMH